MGTSASALYPQYYNPTYSGQTVGYSATTNPTQAAVNNKSVIESQGDEYQNQDQQLANEYATQQGGTQNYLAPIEEANASGQGGYTPAQAAQIQLTPGQEQNIETSAGISSGVNTAASVGAAERAYAASGGNPAALATYRARAAQTQGANAGNAETQAAVQAQQAGAQGAEAVGNAQIAQENQGLNYLGNLQAQQGQQASTEQGLGQSAYGTETQGTTAATGQQINAAQLPTTTDKVIGTVAGAAGAAAGAGGLEDGTASYLDENAVVGENGPEAIVKAASDPVRSNTTFMDNGGIVPDSVGAGYPGGYNDPYAPAGSGSNPSSTQLPAPGAPSSWLQKYLAASAQNSQQAPKSPQPGQPGWNKATPYQQLGTAIGSVARPFIQNAMSGQSSPSTTSTPGFNMPPYVQPPNITASAMPGGLINRTGASIDGVPSLGGDAASDLGGDADSAGELSGLFADGRMGYLDDGDFASHSYARGSSMMADGSAPEAEDYAADPENSSEVARLIGNESTMMAEGGLPAGFHWSEPRPKALHTPAQIPLGYRARPMMADGGVPPAPTFNPAAMAPQMPQPPAAAAPVAARENAAKIITTPTRVHLEKDDMVVPLTYRPKAKVRPSAALPALRPMMHRGGGFRAGA